MTLEWLRLFCLFPFFPLMFRGCFQQEPLPFLCRQQPFCHKISRQNKAGKKVSHLKNIYSGAAAVESVSAGVSWERSHTRKEGGFCLHQKCGPYWPASFLNLDSQNQCFQHSGRSILEQSAITTDDDLLWLAFHILFPSCSLSFSCKRMRGEKHSGVGIYCSGLFYCHVCLVVLVWKLKECYAAVSIHIPLLFVLLLHNILSIQSNDNRIGENSTVTSRE